MKLVVLVRAQDKSISREKADAIVSAFCNYPDIHVDSEYSKGKAPKLTAITLKTTRSCSEIETAMLAIAVPLVEYTTENIKGKEVYTFKWAVEDIL